MALNIIVSFDTIVKDDEDVFSILPPEVLYDISI